VNVFCYVVDPALACASSVNALRKRSFLMGDNRGRERRRLPCIVAEGFEGEFAYAYGVYKRIEQNAAR